VTLIVHDPIVLFICTLSQVAALLYISWTYILELGLKPDLVCNLLRSLSLLLEQTISLLSFFESNLQVLDVTSFSSLSSPRHWS